MFSVKVQLVQIFYFCTDCTETQHIKRCRYITSVFSYFPNATFYYFHEAFHTDLIGLSTETLTASLLNNDGTDSLQVITQTCDLNIPNRLQQ